jgi:6-phosphogluconolactonase
MKRIVCSIVLIMFLNTAFCRQDHFMLVGTYTNTTSTGIYVTSFDARTGDSQLVDSVKTSNPSFLTVSPDGSYVYSVNENANAEGKGGGVSSFSFHKANGKLAEINNQSSGGKHPCYIALDKTGKWLAVGNYSSGNFSILPVNNDHSLDSAVNVIQHNGSGPDKRQASAHVHSAMFSKDNRFLLVNDLGMDKIIVYRFNEITGQVTQHSSASVAAGSGPRHLALHPGKRFAYLLNELTGTINTFHYNTKDIQLVNVQTISSVPDDFKGFAGSADIHISGDGKFLYASNRGDANDIAIYKVNRKKGMLSLLGHQPVLGKAPRNFSIDPSGKFLLCANQDSDEIVVFSRNKKTGLLIDSGKRIKVPKPVCIKWVAAKKG